MSLTNPIITITTKSLRENMDKIISQVSAGQSYLLTKGRGKKKKTVQLLPIHSKIEKKDDLLLFLSSSKFKNSKHKLPPRLNYKNSYKEVLGTILEQKYGK